MLLCETAGRTVGRPRTHLERSPQKVLDPPNQLTERQVLVQVDLQGSPRLGEVGAHEGVRVLQVLDPASDRSHVVYLHQVG